MVIGRRSLLLAGASLPASLSAYGQCVTDKFAVDACRGGVRNTVSLPPGVSLDLSFMSPGTLDPRITFTRASTATYTDASGTIQTAATNAPRWDYDPVTHALRGLLIEEARTNLSIYSADMTNAAGWTAGNIGRAANQAIAPDGTMTAARIDMAAVSGTSFSMTGQGITATAAPYAFSVWLRGVVGGERVWLCTTPDGVTYYRTPVTLTTAWQRVTLVTPALTATIWYIEIGADLRDAAQTSVPAQSVYTWGAQVEQGAFPTSYIPTTAAAVTRAIDVCSMPTNVSWYNANAFSLYWEFDTPNIPGTYGGISDNGFSSNTTYFSSSGFTTMSTSVNGVPALTPNGLSKMCGAAAFPGTARLSNNGGSVVSVPSVGPAPTGANHMSFGNDPWSLSTAFSGHMRRATMWNRALSDTEMQQVTT